MGKLSTLHYLANVHGRNELVMNCHQAVSCDNVVDLFRMLASGVWVVFNNINLVADGVMSVFCQLVKMVWANYPTQKNKGYLSLGDKNVLFTTHEIGLFSTMNVNSNNSHQCNLLSDNLRTFFRSFSLSYPDMRYILECKLTLFGFENVNASRLMRMIELVST